MTKTARLILIGGAELQPPGGGRPVTARRALAVMAMLAANAGQPVPREYLAGTIWSEGADERARASLRQTLSELRGAHPSIAAALTVLRHAITLDRDRIDCDLFEIFAASQNADLAALARVSANFDSQFLYGYEDMGEAFADWLAETRTALRQRVVGHLTRGFDRSDLGEAERGGLARLALDLEPLNESACRTAMLALAKNGDVGQALDVYARFYRQIGEELGMEPSPKTQDLAIAIKRGDFDTPGAAPPVPAPIAPAALPERAPPAAIVPSHRHYGQPLLAVLPMGVLDGDPATAQLGEMLVEDIVCKLAAFAEVPTLSNATTRHAGAEADPLVRLRAQHGIDYGLRLTLRRLRGECRVTAQLVSSDTGVALWAQIFDAHDEALFGLQSQIAEKVVRVLVPTVHANEFRAAEGYRLEDLSAYQQLLRARHLTYSLEYEKLLEARAILRACRERFPGFAPACLGLAEVHSILIGQTWSTEPAADVAAIKRSLDDALLLNPRDARALAMMGHNIGIYERAYRGATQNFDRAISMMPNDADTLVWSAPVLAYSGRHEEARSHANKAIALSPDDPMLFRLEHFASIAHFAAGDYEDAAALGLSSMRRNPRYTSNLRVTIGALAALGRVAEARPLCDRMMDITPGFRVRDFVRWQAFEDAGRREAFGRYLVEAGLPE